MLSKDKKLFLAEAISIEETTVPALILENIKLIEECKAPSEKKKDCIKKMKILLSETNRHSLFFAKLLKKEIKK